MAIFDVQERQLVPELMDDPDLDPRLHEEALRGLRRINLLSNSAGIVAHPIIALAYEARDKPLRVLDIACGSGDVAIGLWCRAHAAGVSLDVHGCDISPKAISEAAANAEQAGAPLTFFRHDVVADTLPEGYDIVMSSLFMHHLEAPEALHVLRLKRDAARAMVLVNDLIRDSAGLALAYLACYGLSRSPVVRFDGPASVRGAFTRAEFQALAAEAGMPEATIKWRWPFRFLMRWEKPHV